jgi:hypothetical protein
MSCPKNYCKGENNDFARQNVEYLGILVTNDGIKLDMKEVKTIQE